jgi:hypothetical protein
VFHWTFDRTFRNSYDEPETFTGRRQPDGFKAEFTQEELYQLLVDSGAVMHLQFFALLIGQATSELLYAPLFWNRYAEPDSIVPEDLGKGNAATVPRLRHSNIGGKKSLRRKK